MRSLPLLFAFMISCTRSQQQEAVVTPVDYSQFKEDTVLLIERLYPSDWHLGLGTVYIKIPHRLDTFYKWTQESCQSVWTKYRFADKKYPQFAESGFFWTARPDSTYQLTIAHRPRKEIPDSLEMNPAKYILSAYPTSERHFRSLSLDLDFEMDSIDYSTLAITVINGRKFLLASFRGQVSKLTWKPAMYAVAFTFLKDREIYFTAECSAKDTAGFYSNVYKSFLSIHINEK